MARPAANPPANQAEQVKPRLEQQGLGRDERSRVDGVPAAGQADRERAAVPDEQADQDHVRRRGRPIRHLTDTGYPDSRRHPHD